MAENAQIVASIESNNIKVKVCSKRELCKSLEEQGYMSNWELDPLEAAYQAVRGRLYLDSCGSGWKCALKILSEFGLSLDVFIVYRDLRRKGRKPRLGFRKRTLIYEHNSRIYEVLILKEGYLERLLDLIEWSRLASADNHVPIIAVVDRTGIVTYYEARASRSLQ